MSKDEIKTHYDEKLAKTEAEIQAAIEKQQSLHESVPKDQYMNKAGAYAELVDIYGHPLNTYSRENAEIVNLIEAIRTKLNEGSDITDEFTELRKVSVHYDSKGDLIYPLLDHKYDITGPSNALWTEDDDILDELRRLRKAKDRDEEWVSDLKSALDRVEQMTSKEENILFPICAVNFTEQEWKDMYHDSLAYDEIFGVEKKVWAEAEAEAQAAPEVKFEDKEIVLPGGHMNLAQLRALLNTIPGEITFVDDENINRFFNEGPKVFNRPSMAIDRVVWTCHPPRVEEMSRRIIEDFRNSRRDEVLEWGEKNGKSLLVRYIAIRDTDGKYIGTLEFVQDITFIKEHFEK